MGKRLTDTLLPEGARCSSVVRAFAYSAMGRRIDPSGFFIPHSSQCSMTGVTKALLCVILSDAY